MTKFQSLGFEPIQTDASNPDEKYSKIFYEICSICH